MGNKSSSSLLTTGYAVALQSFSEDEIASIKTKFAEWSEPIDDGDPKKNAPRYGIKQHVFVREVASQAGVGSFGQRISVRMFKTLDTSRSGKLSLEEFIVCMYLLHKASDEDKLKLLFSMYDADGTGYMVKKDLVEFCVDIIVGSKGNKHTLLLHEENWDGLGEITQYTELVEMMVQMALHRFDLDMDHKLSFFEFLDYAQAEDNLQRFVHIMPTLIALDTTGGNS
mmetsp:Transcript_22726/g.29727  ORF Transcript_22726/g.29727 Transcript_22726/m.29727 type:complete len:226 (+) Transcript_22726:34-711(+)|eukprot:CAMPEP_0117772430 /NCGR_PEP_ID=MMETSP0947-20121206/25089_1 /TAXON_ID=44440 /ORGANISM="Chattonella subsalsa, Strain CCMP2191" /LENGTH=225 /DNA_ID=CAMNT_0005598047 /DNA_START=34 /DNA_END=711 /DNA_ORIENTATION=-